MIGFESAFGLVNTILKKEKMKIIDLNHPIADGMPTYSSDPDVSIMLKKEISTDEEKNAEQELQQLTDQHIKVIDEIVAAKEAEVLEV